MEVSNIKTLIMPIARELESVGVSRVHHQEAWAWSQFQVEELLRYFYTNISLIKKENSLSSAVFQIRVMITSFR